MRKLLPLAFVIMTLGTNAQVPRNVFAEHFTNTVCGICGVRNPALKANFANNPDVIYMTVHPSSPYASCILNQHNVSENDERVQFYNAYGSTPKLVIQNVVNSSAVFGNADLFDAYRGQLSPISIDITATTYTETIELSVTITNETDHNLQNKTLHVFLVEDTIFYHAPNGEQEHYNVFRSRALTPTGEVLSLSGVSGETVSFSDLVSINSAWNRERIRVIAVVQSNDSDQLIEQAKLSTPTLNNTSGGTTGIDKGNVQSFSIYPNPSNELVTLANLGAFQPGTARVFDLTGKMISTFLITDSQSDLRLKRAGVYFVELQSVSGQKEIQKVVIN